MNKQPFYHWCPSIYVRDKSVVTKVIKSIKAIKTVIKNTVDFHENSKMPDNELLFTATSDVSSEANDLIKKTDGVGEFIPIEAEPGDPCDLL